MFKKSREAGGKKSDNVVVGLVLTKRTRRRVHKRMNRFTRRSPARGRVINRTRVCNLSTRERISNFPDCFVMSADEVWVLDGRADLILQDIVYEECIMAISLYGANHSFLKAVPSRYLTSEADHWTKWLDDFRKKIPNKPGMKTFHRVGTLTFTPKSNSQFRWHY